MLNKKWFSAIRIERILIRIEVYGFDSESNNRSTFLSRTFTKRWFGLLVRSFTYSCAYLSLIRRSTRRFAVDTRRTRPADLLVAESLVSGEPVLPYSITPPVTANFTSTSAVLLLGTPTYAGI